MVDNASVDGKSGKAHGFFTTTNIIFIVCAILIAIIAIYYRTTMLGYFGFYEPDGFFHYSVIRAAVEHGFAVPKFLGISGWPKNSAVTESIGLYWATLLPYAFLQYVGVSYYTVMRLVPILFAIFDMIGAFYLARYFNKDKLFGLLVMLFVALSMGNAARTSALVYRGDGFISIFIIIALILMLEVIKSQTWQRKLRLAVLSAAVLSVGNLAWAGGTVAISIYMGAFVLLLAYGFVKEDKAMIDNSRFLLLGILVWSILTSIYTDVGFISAQNAAFTGVYFLLLFIMMAIGTEIARALVHRKDRFSVYMSSLPRRLFAGIALIGIAFLVIYAIAPQVLYYVLVGNGFTANNGFGFSIEELQPPTPAFFFASFGSTIFMTPMSLLLYYSTYYLNLRDLFWLASFLAVFLYAFASTENVDTQKIMGGRAHIKFAMSAALLVLIAYYGVTSYLQLNAVRFNSLLSIPMAIFVAYTVYWLLLYLKNIRNYGTVLLVFGLVLVAALLIYLAYIDIQYSNSLVQADNINPQFISALHWYKSNTNTSAVTLTLWPDGSVVEGVANRTSVTDSVGSQYAYKAGPFATWVLNSSSNPQFLDRNITGRPNYLLVRYTWLLEDSGILSESGINYTSFNRTLTHRILSSFGKSSISQLNASEISSFNQSIGQYYGYDPFYSFSEQKNGTFQSFTLINSQQKLEAKLILNASPGSHQVISYIVLGNRISPYKYIVFYNQYNASYQRLEQTGFNQTNNQTLLLTYSSVPRPGAFVNVTGAIMFNSGIAQSNMFKFLYLCGQGACAWDNNLASLKTVYINSDTKIYKIIYNDTNATAG
ncbi:MAG: hypothetical protein KGH61_01225 [Candidatus Micrarchaeota archaeon]|nr:hypothetical protein [Candidatus Micrarchaeota archaeon]MDE1847553.1 hypothetical protein [Candidatus Micrarchaeota archaeon]MDE1864270.1 hypothetical protein [Candidatus Micrarchaeota archaeon]